MTVRLIWAQAANGVIGRGGTLPWHLPEDLAHFRDRTTGATVVMGRTTWESLPARFRPLPGRRNVVLTRDRRWSAEGAVVAHSLVEAVSGVDGDVWVIGGATVYPAAIGLADRLVVTEVGEAFDGDAMAPPVEATAWQVVERDPPTGWHTSTTGLPYRFVTYDLSDRGRQARDG